MVILDHIHIPLPQLLPDPYPQPPNFIVSLLKQKSHGVLLCCPAPEDVTCFRV